MTYPETGGTVESPNCWRQYVLALEDWIVQHYGKRVRDEACNEAVMAVLTQSGRGASMAEKTVKCPDCGGRGWIARKTGYLKTVTGGLYRDRIARDHCFTCGASGLVPDSQSGRVDG